MPNGIAENRGQTVTLRRWRVADVVTKSGARTRHVWGHDAALDEGRVSSAVADFNLETMTVTTITGAHYRLAGLPGTSRKGQPVWEKWCAENGVVYEKDATNDYMDPEDVSTRQFVAMNDTAFSAKAD